MYKRILIAIDFSDASAKALDWVVRHFPEAEVILFHAIPRFRPPEYVRRALGDEPELRQERELDVRANLELLAEECGLEPEFEIRRGWAPRELGRAAAEARADLIVVGAPRPRLWSHEATDSTVSRIVEQPEIPLYVWRPIPRLADPQDRTVLAALDLRPGSAPVATTAARVAIKFKARLILVHVMTRTLQAYLRAVSSPEVVRDTLAKLSAVARQDALDQVPDELEEQLEIQVQVLRGRPVMQILAVAESESTNLIVLGGSHGPSISGRRLLGGVTNRVMRASNSSILVVPL